MIKKTILILICLTILISCGRKADPKYETYKDRNIIKKV